MQQFILEMSKEVLDTATTKELADAVMFRLEHAEAMIWADLDAVNDRIPGFGIVAKEVVAEGLERMAAAFRTSSLSSWKKG
jgi:hypothetical protein